ncbi:MAG: Ig-like domain-containing protein [Anaerolineales bacterium]|nr:MAG: Ig-like domain-containing protein [Anaerolineales bacterium]
MILTQEAHAADGAPLAEPYVFRFFTPSYLEVGQVIPTPGTQDVEPSTRITVMFNRPVVPLTSLEEMEKLPQPLSFDPPVEGEGEWLNTSIYTFNPSQPLTGGTHYAAIVDATLSDTSGATMKEDFKWTFTVVPPKVVNQSPSPDSVLVPIETSLSVGFNQEIDPQSAQAAFSLSQAGLLRTQPVKGTFTVSGRELTFKPDQWLEFDTDYEVKVAAGVTAPGGDKGMAEDVIWRFKTVPRLKIVDTDPKSGERHAHPYSGFTLYFNAPVDPKTVMPNITMDPPISATQLYTSSGHTSFHFSFGAQPSTEYEVRIGPDIADPYGNKTGQKMTIRFRTDDLPPRLSLHTPGRIATYNAYDPARIYVRYTNVNKASFTLWRIQEGIQDIATNRVEDYEYTPRSQPIRAWDVPLEAPTNQQSYAGIDLVEGGGLLEPGIYMLEVRPQKMDFNQWSHRHILVVSRANMVLKSGPYEMLAWATDLKSGDPLPGIPLIFSERGQNPRTWQKTTDAQGVASLSNNTGGWEYHGLVAYSQSPFAIISSDWGNGISPWDFGLEASYGVQDFRLHIYTDRPIYRPSQTVEFKGVVRTEDDAQYSMPSGIRDVFVTIYDAAYEELYSETLAVSEMGAFFGTLELSDSAALGTYTIQVNFGDEYLEHYFQVAAYRPPEFEVVVTPDKTELAHGSGTQATVDVKYFFGGPMAGAPVEWNIVAQTYRFTPPWGGRYRFTDVDDPWICFDCWWWHDPVPATPILRGSGRTDNNGQLLIEIPPELVGVDGKPITESVRLIIEATAAGKDNQFISGRASVTVHRGNYYIGLAPPKYVNQAEREALVDLVAVDWEGTRLAGKEISISIFRREWQNIFLETATGGYWDWSTKDLLIERVTVQTDDQGQAIASFVPSQGGSYHFIAEGKDAQGRTVRSSTFVWVAGKEHVSWRRDNNDRINLIADKVKYNPGETAEILIPSPFEGPHWALITVERGHIKQHEVVQMVTNSYVYELPITADLVPNIYFSVVLVKGQDQTSKLADYKVGLLPIEVDLVEQELNIEIAPKVEQAEPGQEVTYDLKVTDFEGNPVRAEFSLDLVDKAVLTLNPRSPNAILDAFYSRRGLAVYTACGLTISGNRIVQQIEEELELERGDARATPSPMTTATPSAVELEKALDTAMAEVAPAAEEPAMAGAPPPAPPPGVELREEFADTAYWNPAIMTDNAGRASVALTLPDNLTTWVMRGVGMTTKTTVGEGTHELVVAKPLMVRPVAPRFFVVDDQVQLAALITNNTGQAIQAEVALSSSGLELASAEIQTITIPPHAESKVTWEVKVLDVPEAELIFSAVSTDGEHSDASRPRLATLPDGKLLVLRYSAPDIVGTAGQIDGAGSRTEVIALPPRFNERQGEVSIQVDPSLAASMQDGLQYLEHFEYECTEQTVSRFLPNVLTWHALSDLGMSDPELEAKLPPLVEEGLGKLYVQQHGDGGWGWWTKNDSNVHITTYVLFALLKARQAGFEVRPDVIERAEGFLLPHLAQEIDNSWEANRQAYVLYVLAEDGKAPRNNIAAIYEKRDHLAYYGKAYLALAMWLGNEEDERIKTLLSDIKNGAILSATGAHWEEDARDWWAMNTDTRTTAIILDTLARIDTTNALIPNVVRWLMMARKFGIWETTQETAWALIALTDWMRATGELDANYEYSIFLNDKELAANQATRETVREGIRLQVAVADLLRDVGNSLTIARTDGPGRIYYTAHLRVFLPVEEIEPVDRGIIVSRRYTLADCQDGPRCPEAREVKLGDVIRVDLTIIAPGDLYYVVVEDPLPAGAEAIDTGLATTSMLAMDPSLRRSRPEEESWWSYYHWWWNWYSRSELRDEKVVLFADYLPKGTYEYSYTMRATLPGDYQVIPTLASQFYFPEVFGRGEGRKLTIGRGAE